MVALFKKRKQRVHNKIRAYSNGRKRLVVSRSSRHISVQLIDDDKGITLAQASTLDKELRSKLKQPGNVEAAKQVGELIAKRAKDAKVKQVVFDRGGYLYHGRVKALADAAREHGLEF